MTYLRVITFFLLYFSSVVNANESKIIELHKSKSLDQLVLEKNNNDQDNNDNQEQLEDISSSDLNDDIQESNIENTGDIINEDVTFVNSEILFDLSETTFSKHFDSIKNIKSKTLNREFIKILSNVDLSDQKEINTKIHYVIKKLYEIGELEKAFSLVKKININEVSKKESIELFYLIELNYLYSTFKLSEVCELKSILL